MFSLICALTNGWVNNQDAGDLRRHRAYYDVTLLDNTNTSDNTGPTKAMPPRPPSNSAQIQQMQEILGN